MNYDEWKNNISEAFRDCAGFTLRELSAGKIRYALMFLKEMISRECVAESIIRPLCRASGAEDITSVIEAPSVSACGSIGEAVSAICNGGVLIVLPDGSSPQVYTAGMQETAGRSVSEPTSDVTIRGPKAGFVESSEANISMLRKYIRSPKLKCIEYRIGDVSRTKVCLVYIEERADAAAVADIKKRLSQMKANVITDSGNVAMLLGGGKNTFLPVTGSTEKVDKVASKLVSGRMAIVVDGSPFVLTLPYVFAESLQASDDYLHSFLYATFIRLLRFAALLASVFAPAILCAAVENDGSFLPENLYGIIDKSRADIPVSFFWEIVSVLLLFELLREVGVRMPRTVGDAVGIVGPIILGNTAVDAGIISSVGVITVAFSAVCSFITPAYMYVVVLARLLVLVFSELFGFYGIALCAIAFFLILATKKSFGAYYLTPLIPPDAKGLMDFIFAYPKKTLGKREKLGKSSDKK